MIVRIPAIILIGLALVAPMAHLYELPRKIGLPKERYFAVREIYQGWVLVAYLLPLAMIADVALAFAAQSHARLLAGFASALIVANLIIFMIWTRPVNRITRNGTIPTENWQGLRRQWEYSMPPMPASPFWPSSPSPPP